MAIRVIESFDHYNDEIELERKSWVIYQKAHPNMAFNFVSGRFTGTAINFINLQGAFSTQTHGLRKGFGGTEDRLYFGFAWYQTYAFHNGQYFCLADSNTDQVGIAINGTSNTISVVRGGRGGTVLGTAPLDKIININTWYHLSGEFLISNTTGTASVWLNGELIINLSGVNTRSTANNYANQIQFNINNPTTNLSSYYLDDFYLGDDTGLLNTSCPTEARVTTLYPIANGTLTGWSFSGTANAWQAIDDTAPDNDTSYIYSSVSGTKSTFTFGDLETDADSVYALQFVNYGRKDDADIRATRFLMGMPSGTVYEYGTGSYMGSSYQYFTNLIETDPITAGVLTPTIVNDNEYGIVTSI